MNLIVDIGNTSTKLAVYEGDQIVMMSRVKDLSREELEKVLSPYKIGKAIISSVINLPHDIAELLFPGIDYVHILSGESKLPFIIGYETPETLGSDRIAAVAGAYSLSPEGNTMIIDAGSAITFDFLQGNIYKGGNISPGISMRFKALNKFTGKLPMLSPAEIYSNPGRNTTDAIIAGVITGVLYEINQYIRTFKEENSENKIILTGGDGGFLTERTDYQVTYLPEIVIQGLNYILEYNAK